MISGKNRVAPLKVAPFGEKEQMAVSLRDDFIGKLKKIRSSDFICLTSYQTKRHEASIKAINKLSSLKSYDQIIDVINEFHRTFDSITEMDRRVREFLDETAEYKGVQAKKALPSGDYYLGEIHQGLFHGKGLIDLKNSKGIRYEGEFDSGQIHGLGECVFFHDSLIKKCAGNFYCGKMVGQCEITFTNGDSYQGSVSPIFNGVIGLPSGMGEYTFGDGKKLSGTFKLVFASKSVGFPGEGTITHPDYTMYEGEVSVIEKDKRSLVVEEGYGTRKYPEGSVYKGGFHLGMPQGFGRFQHHDGKERKGWWTEGKLHTKLAKTTHLCQITKNPMLDPIKIEFEGLTWFVDKHALEQSIQKQKQSFYEKNETEKGFDPVFCMNGQPLSQMIVSEGLELKAEIRKWMEEVTISEQELRKQ